MSDTAARARLTAIPCWILAGDGLSVSRRFRYGNFDAAFSAVTRVASLAAREDHHPDVSFGWGYAAFTLTTHVIGGLHENDFIMARLIDEALIDAAANSGRTP